MEHRRRADLRAHGPVRAGRRHPVPRHPAPHHQRVAHVPAGWPGAAEPAARRRLRRSPGGARQGQGRAAVRGAGARRAGQPARRRKGVPLRRRGRPAGAAAASPGVPGGGRAGRGGSARLRRGHGRAGRRPPPRGTRRGVRPADPRLPRQLLPRAADDRPDPRPGRAGGGAGGTGRPERRRLLHRAPGTRQRGHDRAPAEHRLDGGPEPARVPAAAGRRMAAAHRGGGPAEHGAVHAGTDRPGRGPAAARRAVRGGRRLEP